MDYYTIDELLVMDEKRQKAKKRKKMFLSYYHELESNGVPKQPEIPDLPD